MMKLWVCLFLAVALLTGCTTVAPSPLQTTDRGVSDPLMQALTAPVDHLEDAASRGEASAQFALSIVLTHGLQGQSPDLSRAAALRSEALARRPGLTLTQYIPGINGQAGRVVPLVVQGAMGFPGPIAARLDGCVETLRKSASDSLIFDPGSWSDEEGAFERREAEQLQRAETCGGPDAFGALTTIWSWERPWGNWPLPDCDEDGARCRVLEAKIARLNGRNPRLEAVAAAARGDFRLGATNHIGPMPQGWDTSGVACRTWALDMVGKWHVNQDVIQPGDPQHTAASTAFIAVYNRSLIQQPAFPFKDVCGALGGQPAQRYEGPVSDYAQAARTRDPARLTEVALGMDINGKDIFGSTALDWAMRNRDEAMARALLEAGADPNAFEASETAPLAQALNADQFSLARLMLARGAKVEGSTGRCERYSFAGPPEGNQGCSWAGLLVLKGQFDLLDELATRDESRTWLAAGSYEIDETFLAAVRSRDQTTVRRLLPHAGHGSRAGVTLKALSDPGARDTLLAYVAAHGADAARSPSEAQLWRTAAGAGQIEILALLRDRGADVNFLSPLRLAACGSAVANGETSTVEACIAEAAERKQQLETAVRSGDESDVRRLLADVGDLRERG